MTTNKHDQKAAPKEAAPAPAFPYTASINEPQTVSTPIPADVEVPVPAITSIAPDTCVTGDADFTLVVTGDNFFGDSVINFAGQDEPTTLQADGTLTTGVKPSLWADPVTVPVIIKNGPASSAPVDFDFTAPAARKSEHKREK